MPLLSKVKHHFFNAFRELFVHHHGSLEFRAKVFALVIVTNEEFKSEDYVIVNKIGQEIYKNNEQRVNLLFLSIQELVKKVKDDNGLDIDTLIMHIQKELKFAPRYAKKIDIEALKEIVSLSKDEDTIAYQNNILEFLQKIKDETLKTKKSQIAKDEENLDSNSKY